MLFPISLSLPISNDSPRSFSATPKNPVVALNELRPGLKYELVETKGPVHMPVFVLEVTVNGQGFRGEGR